MLKIALDSSSINILDSRLFPKNIYSKFRPTRNVLRKYNKLREFGTDLDCQIGLFCNGTFGLDPYRIDKVSEVFGIYLSKDFFFEKILEKYRSKKKKLEEKIIDILCRDKIEVLKSKINNYKVFRGIAVALAIKREITEVFEGNIRSILMDIKANKMSVKSRGLKNEKMVLRVDHPWIYFSIFNELKNDYMIQIDYSISNQLCPCRFFDKFLRITNLCGDAQVCFDTTSIDLGKLVEYSNCFFGILNNGRYSDIKCKTLVINYITGSSKEIRDHLLKKFFSHIGKRNIKDPMVVIKFRKNDYYAAENMFDIFLQNLCEIYNKNK